MLKIFNTHINKILFLLISLTTLVKLSLYKTGYFSYLDEFRYIYSQKAFNAITKLEFGQTLDYMFSVSGKPFDVFLKMIPFAFQYIYSNINGFYIFQNSSFLPLFIFNIIIYLTILYFIYKICNLLITNKTIALFVVLLYSSLINSYFYLNHVLPYDLGLLIYTISMYYTIKHLNNLTLIKSFIIGVLCFLGFITYPGYMPLFLLNAYLIFLYNCNQQFKQNIFNSISFSVGAIASLSLTQILSKIGGHNYILDTKNFSKTITHGDFNETFVFIFKYLFEIERLNGLLTISFIIFASIFLFKKIKLTHLNPTLLLFSGLISIYIFYASLGYFGHKFVMYSRLLHQYLPLLIITSSIIIFNSISLIKKWWILSISFFISLFFFKLFFEQNKYKYPRDIAWSMISQYDLNKVKTKTILPDYIPIFPFSEIGRYTNYTIPSFNKNDSLTFINFSHIFPTIKQNKIETHFEEKKLIINEKHFLTNPASSFEGCSLKERNFIKKNQKYFNIMVYEK